MQPTSDYLVLRLRETRVPSFFFLDIDNGNSSLKVAFPTIQYTGAETTFTGQKPDSGSVSEFIHAKLCMISCGEFEENPDKSRRIELLGSNAKVVDVGTVRVTATGFNKRGKLLVDNSTEQIILRLLD
jgi:hypothetical protein